MHQTVGNVLRTLLHSEPPQNYADAKEFVDEALSIAMHAMRAGIPSTLGSSPGSLVFNRDMFLNIPLIPNWHAITQKREHLIHENLIQENQKRRQYDYLPEQHVVIGHGLMKLLSIAKWRDSLNSQLPVYDGDRQAPPDLLNLLLEGTDLDPDEWLTRHKSIPAFPRRNSSASLNRSSFGSKRYF
jgi:hypothetical protein